MGSVTIRNIDDETKHNARLVAAANGRSLEAELRALLERTYASAQSEHEARIKAMSGAAFVDHLIQITRPGFESDPFATARADKSAGPFDAD